jgi:hypothetical protein
LRVCAYAIFRDEERNVAAWAETTVDAEERFVLDTGSQDTTTANLALHGIDYDRAVFDPFRFDDARNAALALAPEADLYLRLDADERLCDDWREILNAAYSRDVARYRYRVDNVGGIWGRITRDDLHRREGFRWRYPTHEILVGPAATRDLPGLIVTHTSPPERRTHHVTNLDVLRAATVEYPGDHRMIFYYGRELWYAGRWDEARQILTAFLALAGGWPPERSEAYRILAAIDYMPERWLWKAIGECPERREPWVDLTRHFLGVGKEESAVLTMSFAYHRTDDTIYTTDPQCWGEPFEELMHRVSEIDAEAAHLAERHDG